MRMIMNVCVVVNEFIAEQKHLIRNLILHSIERITPQAVLNANVFGERNKMK